MSGLEDDFFEVVDPVMKGLGAASDVGEDFGAPPLDVLRYYWRVAKLGRAPVFGRALAVVAVVREPVDLPFSKVGHVGLVKRVATAVNGRFPPRPLRWGLSIGLVTIVLAEAKIGPGDEEALNQGDVDLRRTRAVSLGAFRVNLEQKAMAMAHRDVSGGAFPEPSKLADALCERFGRFVLPAFD